MTARILSENQKRVGSVLLVIIVSAWAPVVFTQIVDLSPSKGATVVSALGMLAFLVVMADE